MAEFIIALLELLEAEGRDLRRGIHEISLGLGFIIVGGILLLSGIVFLALALYLYLTRTMPPSTVMMICGLLSLIISGGLIWIASRLMR